MRQRLRAWALLNSRAMSIPDMPHETPTAAAARATETKCSPCSKRCTATLSSPGTVRSNEARPWLSSWTPVARTPADLLSPNHTTGASDCSAMALTAKSSQFSTATPSADRALTNSDFARAISSGPFIIPTCASPTLRTTPMSGSAISARYAMCPIPRIPISSTR